MYGMKEGVSHNPFEHNESLAGNSVSLRLGIISGNRQFPILFAKSARTSNKNIKLIALCFQGETDYGIAQFTDKHFWLHVGQLEKLVTILKAEGITKVVLVGQIRPVSIFRRRHWDEHMHALVEGLKDFRPHTVFSLLIRHLESEGIECIDSTLYMKDSLAQEGPLSDLRLSAEVRQDVDFGIHLASKFVELDVGQSIVVKKKAVVALEGLEGTDRTIRRAYRLAGAGACVFKFSKKDQDFRFDVPIVGMDTLKILKKTKASCLVLEAQKVIILEKDTFLQQARRWGIPIIGAHKVS